LEFICRDCGLCHIIMVALCNRADHYIFILFLLSFFLFFPRFLFFFLVVLCNRADHYIFMWFLLCFFFFFLFLPRLISAAADWMSTILPYINRKSYTGFPTSHQRRFYAAPNFLKMGIKYLNLSSFIQVSTIKDEKSAAKCHYITRAQQ